MSLADFYSKLDPAFADWLKSDSNEPVTVMFGTTVADGGELAGRVAGLKGHRDLYKKAVCNWLEDAGIIFSDTTLPTSILAVVTPEQTRALLEAECADAKGHQILTSMIFLPEHLSHLTPTFDHPSSGEKGSTCHR
ncbi:MAG: hypothetical protein ACOYJ2_06310 [Rickettsiales bacterium]